MKPDLNYIFINSIHLNKIIPSSNIKVIYEIYGSNDT